MLLISAIGTDVDMDLIPLPTDDAGDTGGRMSESAEASRGTCRYNCGVGSLLISISCEEGSEGHSV